MARSRHAKLSKNKDSQQLAFQEHETDSPLLPVQQLKELNTFKPELIDWIVAQTEKEGNWRRKEYHRINTFVFCENLIGQIFGLIIGVCATAGGIYIVLFGDAPWQGTAIVGIGISGLATAFVFGNKRKIR